VLELARRRGKLDRLDGGAPSSESLVHRDRPLASHGESPLAVPFVGQKVPYAGE
jgi:hypothetical protein